MKHIQSGIVILMFILISGCIYQFTEITKEKAIDIANQTEEVREFLKLYPSANVRLSEDTSSMTVTYSHMSSEVKIGIDKSTVRITSRYPALEYIKNRTYCEKNDDCVPATSKCACVNFIHKYPPEGIVEEVCGPAIAVSECECVNNRCIGK